MAPEVEAQTSPRPVLASSAPEPVGDSADLVHSPLRDFNLRGLDVWEAYLGDREKLELDEAKGLLKRLWGSTGYAFISGQTEIEWIQKKYNAKRAFVAELRRGLQSGEAPNVALLLEKIDQNPASPWQKDAHHYRTFARQLADTQAEVELIDALRVFPPTKETKLTESMSSAFDLEARGAGNFAQTLYALVQKDFSGSVHRREAERGLKALSGESDLGRSIKKVIFGIDPADMIIETGLFLISDGLANAAKGAAIRAFDIAAEGFLAKGIKAFAFSGSSTVTTHTWRSMRHDSEVVWKSDHVAKSFGIALVMAPVQGAAAYLGEGVGLQAAQRLGWMKSGGVGPSARGEALVEGTQHLFGFGGTVLVHSSVAPSSVGINDVLVQSALGYVPWGVQRALSGSKVALGKVDELDPVIRKQAIEMARTKLEQWQKNPAARLELEDFFVLVETGHLPPAERDRVQTLWAERSFKNNEGSAPYVSVAAVTGPHSPELVPTLKELMPILYHNYAKRHLNDHSNMTDFVVCGAGNCQARGKLTAAFADRRGMGPEHLKEEVVLGLEMFSDHIQPVAVDRRYGFVWDPWTGKSKTQVEADIYDPAIFFFSFLKKQGESGPWKEQDFLIAPSIHRGNGGGFAASGIDNQGHFSLPRSSVAFGDGPSPEGTMPPPPGARPASKPSEGGGLDYGIKIPASPTKAQVAAVSAGVLGAFVGTAWAHAAYNMVNPDSDEQVSPLLYRMWNRPRAQGYGVWQNPDRVPEGSFRFLGISERDLVFHSDEAKSSFLKLNNTEERIEFLLRLTANDALKKVPADLHEKFLRLQLDPHQAIREMSVEEIALLSKGRKTFERDVPNQLQVIAKLHGVDETAISKKIQQKLPWLKDPTLSNWSQWIDKHPAEFLSFFNELPPQKQNAVLEMTKINVSLEDHIEFESSPGAPVRRDDPVFGPVPGVNVTPPMKADDLLPEASSEGDPADVSAGLVAGVGTATTVSAPENKKARLSVESLILLNFKRHFIRIFSEPGKMVWTPEMSNAFFRMNRMGEWDREFANQMFKAPGASRKNGSSLVIVRSRFSTHFQPVIEEIYQRNPQWFAR